MNEEKTYTLPAKSPTLYLRAMNSHLGNEIVPPPYNKVCSNRQLDCYEFAFRRLLFETKTSVGHLEQAAIYELDSGEILQMRCLLRGLMTTSQKFDNSTPEQRPTTSCRRLMSLSNDYSSSSNVGFLAFDPHAKQLA